MADTFNVLAHLIFFKPSGLKKKVKLELVPSLTNYVRLKITFVIASINIMSLSQLTLLKLIHYNKSAE